MRAGQAGPVLSLLRNLWAPLRFSGIPPHCVFSPLCPLPTFFVSLLPLVFCHSAKMSSNRRTRGLLPWTFPPNMNLYIVTISYHDSRPWCSHAMNSQNVLPFFSPNFPQLWLLRGYPEDSRNILILFPSTPPSHGSIPVRVEKWNECTFSEFSHHFLT